MQLKINKRKKLCLLYKTDTSRPKSSDTIPENVFSELRTLPINYTLYVYGNRNLYFFLVNNAYSLCVWTWISYVTTRFSFTS